LASAVNGSYITPVLKLRAWRLALAHLAPYWFLAVAYLLSTRNPPQHQSLLLAFLALILSAAWGFLLNDYFDSKFDKTSGKDLEERGHPLGKKTRVTLIVITAVSGWGLMIASGGDRSSLVLLGVAYALSYMYSAEPIRLKEKGAMGLVANSLMERPLPILTLFAHASQLGPNAFLFATLSELTWTVFKHQVADLEADRLAGLRTGAVILGRETSNLIVSRILNPLGVVSTVGLVLMFNATAVSWAVPPILAGYVLAVVLGALVGGRLFQRATPTDPSYVMTSNAFLKLVITPAFLMSASPSYLPLLLLLAISVSLTLFHYSTIWGMIWLKGKAS